MKKTFFASLIILMFLTVLHADSAQYTEACGQIGSGELDAADAIADSIMKSDPKNPESYTLKSSIMLSRYFRNNDGMSVIRNFNESVFSNAAGYTCGLPRVLNEETALKSEALLMKAINNGPKWITAYYTICYMYSISYNTDKLIKMLGMMKKRFPSDSEMPGELGDYAQNLYKRGDFDGAVKVYNALIRLWPERSAFVNDLGVVYVTDGIIDKALSCAIKCMAMDDADAMTAMTACSIFTLAGRYEDGLKAARLYSKLEKNDYKYMYEGFYKYINGIRGWKQTMQKCVNSHEDDLAFIKSFLQMKDEKDFDGLKLEIADGNTHLMALYGLASKYPKNDGINLNLGYYLAYKKNYSASAAAFDRMEKAGAITAEVKAQVDFYRAWALQSSGRITDADTYWKRAAESREEAAREAANYFLGKNAQKAGEFGLAKKYLEKVVEKDTASKYCQMANDRLNNLNDQNYEYGRMMDTSDCMILTPSKDKDKKKE